MNERLVEILQNFDLDPEFGFLLRSPQSKLPSQYQPWQNIVDELPELLDSGEIESRIAALPLIETTDLCSHCELRLAHLLLATLSAAHVWHKGADKPCLSLPRQIAVPFISVSKKLGMKPVVCHASMCLANWRFKNDNVTFRAENIKLIGCVFTRHIGNQWFFALTAQMETEFAPAIVAMAKSCADSKIFDNTFSDIQKSLITTTATIRRMKEHLPPAIFYHGFRLFLNGYTEGNFLEQGGIVFEGREDLGSQMLSGASAAQSSPLHAIDAFLQIRHPEKEQFFLRNQRQYMPPRHKEFIEWIEEKTVHIDNLCQFKEYQETVAALRQFRSQHIKVVTEYIILQMKPGQQTSGTGGSTVMEFLKTIRNDCDL